MQKQKKRGPTRIREIAEAGPLDWTPLFGAFEEAFEWALNVGAQLARDYPEEVEAVERVRTFMRHRIAGRPSHVRVDDVMFTFGLIIGAIERDLGPIATLGPWFAPAMQFPSVSDLWSSRIPTPLMWALGQSSSRHHHAVA